MIWGCAFCDLEHAERISLLNYVCKCSPEGSSTGVNDESHWNDTNIRL